jgi:hypothetical protein
MPPPFGVSCGLRIEGGGAQRPRPKGTFKIGLITKSSKGKTYEDIRTFHTCVPGKRKKK